MGRQLQKKKAKSSIPKQTRRRNPRVHKITSFGSSIIAKNWDPKQTLTQNYARLGLSSKLNVSTWCPPARSAASSAAAEPELQPGEARIVRDGDGNVVRVEHAASADAALDAEVATGGGGGTEVATGGGGGTEVVRALEELAERGIKTVRGQSDREKEWVQRLVRRYGEDYKAMARDLRLNPRQQTVGEVRRRVERWRADGGEEEETR